MDVAGEDDVHASTVEELFHGEPHLLPFPLVSGVGIVPGRMDQDDEPGCPSPVHFCQVGLQPAPLVRTGPEVGVGGKHDDVDGPGHVEGVVEV